MKTKEVSLSPYDVEVKGMQKALKDVLSSGSRQFLRLKVSDKDYNFVLKPVYIPCADSNPPTCDEPGLGQQETVAKYSARNRQSLNIIERFRDFGNFHQQSSMRTFIVFILILTLLWVTGNGQSFRLPQRRSMSRLVQPSSDEATRAWPSFWRVIVSNINTRNRTELKRLMPDDFFDGLEIVTSDAWFKFIDSRRLWRGLQKSFAGGTVIDPNQAVPTRLTMDRMLYFEFRNGRWYFAGVMGD